MASVLELLGLDKRLTLNKWQTEVFTRFLDNLRSDTDEQSLHKYALCGAHGVGKTTLGALMVLAHLVLCSKLDKERSYRAVVYSGSEKQLKQSLWSEIDLLIQMSPVLQRVLEYTSQKVELRSDRKFSVHARACNLSNIQSLAGVHADNILIVADEATAIGDGAFQKMETFFTSGRAHWLVMANPTTTIGYFHDIFTSENNWYKRVISRFDMDEKDPFAHEMEVRYGIESDEYRIRVLGLFPLMESGGLMPRYILNRAAEDDRYSSNTRGPYAIGVDVATDEGANYSAFAVLNSVRVLDLYRDKIKHDEYILVLKRTIDYYAARGLVYVGIDSIGVGFGLFQMLQAHYAHNRKVKIIGIKGNDPPKMGSYNLRNRRIELFFNARAWLKETGYVPGHALKGQLFDELQLIKTETKGDLINLVPKKELDTPVDLADAFAYAFAFDNLLAQDLDQRVRPNPGMSRRLTLSNFLIKSSRSPVRSSVSSKYD